MKEKQDSYNTTLIDFAQVGVELASLLEQASEILRHDFIDQSVKILPLLYIKARLLPKYDYDPTLDYAPEYISEESYDFVGQAVAAKLGEYDSFLTTMLSDMQYSDAPMSASISEYLADVYQQVGNLLGVLREEETSMLPTAIGRCRYYFAEYWGRHLLAALQALHELSVSFIEDEGDSMDKSVPYI